MKSAKVIPLKPSNLPKDFMKTFSDAVVASLTNTLKLQCSTEVVADKSFLYNGPGSIQVDICSVIGVGHAEVSGALTLCFTKKAYLAVMEGMLGEKYNDITPDIFDGAGEILNITFGSARKSLADSGFNFEPAIPTIVAGSDIQLNSFATQGKTHCYTFRVGNEKIHLLVAVTP